jgi:hypothetical protein
MSDCQCPARFSGNDEAEYSAHGCPNCVCVIIEKQSEESVSMTVNAWRNLKPGPAIILNEKDWNDLMEAIENPPPPTEALKQARQRFLDLRKQDIQDKMDEQMVVISAPKRL